MTPDPGPLRLLPRADAAPVLGPLYERRRRPGMLVRTPEWWRDKVLDDDGDWEGFRKPSVVVLGDPGVPRGYAIYRSRQGDDAPGKVAVQELVGEDAAAEAALWSYLASLDLIGTVEAWNRPEDDLLPLLVADGDRLRITSRFATQWLRLVDAPAALAALDAALTTPQAPYLADEF